MEVRSNPSIYPSGHTVSIQENPAAEDTSRGSMHDSSLADSELSIIFVNWNSLDYLLECIASIYEHTYGFSFEIIVVDNASPEGGIECVTQKFPAVRLIRSERNIGFAGANNLGFKRAVGRHILLLNPDTRLICPAINIMLDRLKALPYAGIVGCKLLNSDLSVSTTSIQKFPTVLNQLLNFEYFRLRFPACPLWNIEPLFIESREPVVADVIPGACMMLKREVFERAGLLSEDYFMYAEDIDLNFKIKRLGLFSYYIGETQLIHHGGRSSSTQGVSQWSTIMMHRAMVRFFRMSRGRAYSVVYQASMAVAAVVRLLILAMAFPFGNKPNIRCAAAKWATILKWAIGIEKLGADR